MTNTKPLRTHRPVPTAKPDPTDPKSAQFGTKIRVSTRNRIDALADHLELSYSDVLEHAIRELAEKEGIE